MDKKNQESDTTMQNEIDKQPQGSGIDYEHIPSVVNAELFTKKKKIDAVKKRVVDAMNDGETFAAVCVGAVDSVTGFFMGSLLNELAIIFPEYRIVKEKDTYNYFIKIYWIV